MPGKVRYLIEGRSGHTQPGSLVTIDAKDQFPVVRVDPSVAGFDEWPPRLLEMRLEAIDSVRARTVNLHRINRVIPLREALGDRMLPVERWIDDLVNRCGWQSPDRGAHARERCEALLAEHIRRVRRYGVVERLRLQWLDRWSAVGRRAGRPLATTGYDAALQAKTARLSALGNDLERSAAHGVRVQAMTMLVRVHAATLLRSALASTVGGFLFVETVQRRACIDIVEPTAAELAHSLTNVIVTTVSDNLPAAIIRRFFNMVHAALPAWFLEYDPALAALCRDALMISVRNWLSILKPLLGLVADHSGALAALPGSSHDAWEPLTDMFALGVMPMQLTASGRFGVFAPLAA